MKTGAINWLLVSGKTIQPLSLVFARRIRDAPNVYFPAIGVATGKQVVKVGPENSFVAHTD